MTIKNSHLKVKYISVAVQKSVAKEVSISWSDYFPICPRCGSWSVERTQGKLWNYCPECGQKIKDIVSERTETQWTRFMENVLGKFLKKD